MIVVDFVVVVDLILHVLSSEPEQRKPAHSRFYILLVMSVWIAYTTLKQIQALTLTLTFVEHW